MRITERAHEAVRTAVKEGEEVVDATAGNGHDTVFLAKLVGAGGRVFAFDIQEEAIVATQANLHASGVPAERVSLIRESHASLGNHIIDPVAAVMFNLGYRPGGDHKIRTRCEETLVALERAWEVIRTEGILTVICYRGHPGGAEESTAVLAAAHKLAMKGAVINTCGVEETTTGPFLVAVRKGQHPPGQIG